MRQAAGQQRRAVAQRQHDEGQRRRQVERRRGQEGDAQHAHGAPPQFVGRRGQRARLGLRLAVQHDGGDAAHAVEEARLQPGERQELAARGCGGADAGSGHRERHQQARTGPGSAPASRSASRAASATSSRAGDRQHRSRKPAGEQPVQRLDAIHHGRGQFAGMVGAQLRRAGMKQPGQRVAAQPTPRRRAGVEGRAIGSDRQGRPQQRQHDECRQRQRRIRTAAAQRGSPARRRRTRPGRSPAPCPPARTARPAARRGGPRAIRAAATPCVAACRTPAPSAPWRAGLEQPAADGQGPAGYRSAISA